MPTIDFNSSFITHFIFDDENKLRVYIVFNSDTIYYNYTKLPLYKGKINDNYFVDNASYLKDKLLLKYDTLSEVTSKIISIRNANTNSWLLPQKCQFRFLNVVKDKISDRFYFSIEFVPIDFTKSKRFVMKFVGNTLVLFDYKYIESKNNIDVVVIGSPHFILH